MASGNTTFHFVLDGHKKPNDEQAVYLRVTQDKKSIWLRTSISVKKANFNKDSANYKWVRTKDIDNAVKNTALKKIKDRAEALYFDADGGLSLQKLKALFYADDDSSLFDVIDKIIEEKRATRSGNTASTYVTLKNWLLDFCKSRRLKDILLAEIDAGFVRDFDLYLRTSDSKHAKDKRKLKQSSVNILIKRLEHVVKMAPDGLVKGNPFQALATRRSLPAVKDVLTKEEIKSIESVSLDKENERNARDVFLFSYYCSGMRGGDVLTLRWKHLVGDDRIQYRMRKTGKVRNVYLVSQAKGIIEKYRMQDSKPADFIFPYLNGAPWFSRWDGGDVHQLPADLAEEIRKSVNTKMSIVDRGLKSVIKKAGITKHISVHSARHSFATEMLNSGVESAVIKSALGHSSLQMTENYLRELDNSKVDVAVQNVFDKENNMNDLRNALARLPKDKLDALLKEITPQE